MNHAKMDGIEKCPGYSGSIDLNTSNTSRTPKIMKFSQESPV
jgi:hypothetical protein